MSEAVALMAQRKISELPVVDGDGRPVGLIDVTDVVGLLPQKAEGEPSAKTLRDSTCHLRTVIVVTISYRQFV